MKDVWLSALLVAIISACFIGCYAYKQWSCSLSNMDYSILADSCVIKEKP